MLKTPRSRRVFALALLAAVSVAAVAVIALPVYFVRAHFDNEIARMQRQLTAFSALNRQRPQIVQAVDLLKSRDARKYFLRGASPALASAELQEATKSAVENNGGRVLSTQALSGSDESGYRRVGAMFQINSNIQNLRRILYALETKEPYLFVDALSVRAQVSASYKPSPGVEPDMFIQFEIFAYALSAPKPESTAAPATNNSTSART